MHSGQGEKVTNLATHNNSSASTVRKLLREVGEAEFFPDPQGRPHGTFLHEGRFVTVLLQEKDEGMVGLLRSICRERLRQTLSRADSEEVISLLAERARGGEPREVYCRVGRHVDGFALDLCRNDGKVVVIRPGSWETGTSSPAKFRRPRGPLPLPIPVPGPKRQNLIQAVNSVLDLRDRQTQILTVGYLLGILNPSISLPVFEIVGSQGSGKSTRSKAIKGLVDPNYVPVRRLPSDERDFFIAASNSWLLAFDNISRVPSWFSDAACSVATGGGYATRRLYADEEEVLFNVRRPIIVNAIHPVITRADLRDRALTIRLPDIGPHDRILEEAFWARFLEAHPPILGLLLDCVAMALLVLDLVQPPQLPRMADFYRWILAATEAPELGFTAEEFEAAFASNRNASHELAIDGSPIGRPLLNLLEGHAGQWSGTHSDLLRHLNQPCFCEHRDPREWPKTPEALSHSIARIQVDLKALGVSVRHFLAKGRGRERLIELSLEGPQ